MKIMLKAIFILFPFAYKFLISCTANKYVITKKPERKKENN